MTFILIIIIIVLAIKYNDLKIELENLKRINNNNNSNNDNNYCPNCGFDLRGNKHPEPIKMVNNNIINPTPVIVPNSKPKNEMSEKEIKNSTILVTGAILILIAAIVFLTSMFFSLDSAAFFFSSFFAIKNFFFSAIEKYG